MKKGAQDAYTAPANRFDQMPREPIIDPELPIVDAHHHLWFQSESRLAAMARSESIISRALTPVYRRYARYLFDEYMADVRTGHNIRASIFIDAHLMYRAGGPQAMKSIGEVEFVNGIAAMSASGNFGEVQVCAGIVGGVDLRLGDAVEEVLTAHLQAAGGRYKGVRSPVCYDPDASILGPEVGKPHLLLDDKFRDGFRRLKALELSFDAFVLEPQLSDLIDLAHTFPDTQIILNHLGTPLGIGRYTGQLTERFLLWRDRMRALSRYGKVTVKLGGLGMPFAGFEIEPESETATSVRLAEIWRPYIETCIEAFGVTRCMFESNFPVESAACSYLVLWNVFKRIASGASEAEKEALFSTTAARVYRLDLP